MRQFDCDLVTDLLYKVTKKRTPGLVRDLDRVVEELLTRPYGGPSYFSGNTIWVNTSPGTYVITASANLPSSTAIITSVNTSTGIVTIKNEPI